jgi:hypothetical protein
MRPIMIAAATAVALMAASSASSAQSSFYNKRFCANSGGSEVGAADCSFNTLEQCRSSIYGIQYCTENRFWKQDTTRTRQPS